MNSNSETNSYFIGYIFKDEMKPLSAMQHKISQDVNVAKVLPLHSPFIYLGKLKEELANQFLQYLNPLFLAIVENNGPLHSTLKSFKFIKMNHKYYFVICYENKHLENHIIPFLKKYGTDHIIETHYLDKNHLYIPLTMSNDMNEDIKDIVHIPYNPNFEIDSIDVYKINKYNEISVVTTYPLEK